MTMKTFNNSSTIERGNSSSDDCLTTINLACDISDDIRHIVETVCSAGLTTVVCVFGVPTNIINCIVFWRQGLKDRMNLCLFTLALVDVFYLMFMFTVFSVSSFIGFVDKSLGDEYYLKSAVMFIGVAFAFRLTSWFITMVIAVERCVCVTFPLSVHSLLKTRTMAVLLLIIFLISHGYHLMVPFLRRAVLVQTEDGGQWMFASTEIYENNKFIIEILGTFVVGTAIPLSTFLTVLAATIITVTKLQAAMSWRGKSTSSLTIAPQMALTSMLVIVSCVYIISMLPLITWHVIITCLPDLLDTKRLHNMLMTVDAIVHCFPLINSSIHFIVYYSRSSRYRRTLRSFWCVRTQSGIEAVLSSTKSEFTVYQ